MTGEEPSPVMNYIHVWKIIMIMYNYFYFRSSYGHIASSVFVLGVLWLQSGCSPAEPGLVAVRGKVTLDGGPWPRPGTINFAPVSAPASEPGGAKSRPGSAKFGTDGSFVAGSFEEGDGLFPGTYNVSVDCAESAPTMSPTGAAIEAKNAVPKNYQDPSTSGLTITVKAGEKADLTLDVKTK